MGNNKYMSCPAAGATQVTPHIQTVNATNIAQKNSIAKEKTMLRNIFFDFSIVDFRLSLDLTLVCFGIGSLQACLLSL